ncbi:MAG: Gfo/Idh/MocA family oxidoreductase [Anaerolineae bacterium]|nr:Gfo/Idh/MocA family oxidoreductase [Anaerolineae bacterium]MCA9894323.1 Gfo/Idh/MocA family oxidoreductase [Anaerolineae bacterium]MCB9458835.1 Gfo/Idh/MocA family oxidoreductase [Anaerolineaceae bacterium]
MSLSEDKIQINIAMIGAGYWGPNLIRNFVEMSRAKLVAVADLDINRLDAIQRRYPTIKMTTTDYRELFRLENLDAVVIATPPTTHRDIARECMLHGLHVMVEKPLTLSVEESQELVDLAKERNLKLMVGHTYEYNAAIRAIKDIIESGEIGEVYYVDSVRTNLGLFSNKINVMWDLAPHDISVLHFLFGEMPNQISATGKANIVPNIHDIVYMHMDFPSGISAHLRASWLDPQKVRQLTVVGSKKMLVFDDVASLEKIKIYDKGVETLPYTETYKEFHLSYRYGDIVIPNISFVEPLRVECEHFVDSILLDSAPQTDGINGLRVVSVLEAAQRSLENQGKMMPIELDEKYTT